MPVETLTTLVIAPLPGKTSLGMDTSGFVDINLAPLRTANVALIIFHMLPFHLNQ